MLAMPAICKGLGILTTKCKEQRNASLICVNYKMHFVLSFFCFKLWYNSDTHSCTLPKSQPSTLLYPSFQPSTLDRILVVSIEREMLRQWTSNGLKPCIKQCPTSAARLSKCGDEVKRFLDGKKFQSSNYFYTIGFIPPIFSTWHPSEGVFWLSTLPFMSKSYYLPLVKSIVENFLSSEKNLGRVLTLYRLIKENKHEGMMDWTHSISIEYWLWILYLEP